MAKGNFCILDVRKLFDNFFAKKGKEKEWCDMVTFYGWNKGKNIVVQQTKLSNLFPLIFKLF